VGGHRKKDHPALRRKEGSGCWDWKGVPRRKGSAHQTDGSPELVEKKMERCGVGDE